MSFFNIKNPKEITHENINFYQYANSKEINILEVVITRDSPIFKINKTLNVDKLTINGVLLKYPVCSLPKFGFLNNFYSLKINQFNFEISTTEISSSQYNDYYGRLSDINKKFKTNYKKRGVEGYTTKDNNFGCLYIHNPNNHSSIFNENYISIYGSYKDYLTYLYDNLVNTDVDIYLSIAFQKIKEWDFFPIVDISIRSGKGNMNDYDLEEMIKGEIFSRRIGDNFPKYYNILI